MADAEQRLRVGCITAKFKTLEKSIENLQGYWAVNPNPINANLRLASVTTLYHDYFVLNEELTGIQPNHALVKAFEHLSNIYYDLAASVTQCYNESQQARAPVAHSTLNSSKITISERSERPRLPVIELPKFDGSRDNWENFKVQYQTLVHNRPDIGDDVKASQLFRHVTGGALAKISEYRPCGEHYESAWKALLESYDHKRIVAIGHLNALLDLPRLEGKASAKSLSALLDSAQQHFNVLKRIDAKPSDELVVRIIERCLPPSIYNKWNDQLEVDRLPTLDSLFKFIRKSVFRLEALDESTERQKVPRKRPADSVPHYQSKISKSSARSLVTMSSKSSTSTSSTSGPLSCPKCKAEHRLFQCSTFKSLNVQDRWRFAKTNKICYNCLWDHPLPCSSDRHCKKCDRRHHTLLQTERGFQSTKEQNSKSNKDATSSFSESPQSRLIHKSYASMAFPSESQLMPTAVVKVKDKKNHLVTARALLDSCSTVNLIIENFSKLLALPKSSCSVNIGAVDGLCTVSNNSVHANVRSNYNNSQHQITFLVVSKIADAVPNDTFPRNLFEVPKNLKLADPQFHLPKPIDILLSSSITLSVLAIGQIKLHHDKSEIILQKTSLGWNVAGGASDHSSCSSNSALCNVVKLDKLIERFWFIEDFDHEPVKSRDEVACEQHYLTHTKRDPTGRYIVRLPFRDTKFNLGQSRGQALRRYQSLERKFERNPALKVEYTKVMEEYLSLGHMTRCSDTDDGYFLPHHAVIKESSDATKLRVVFDASSKTTTGISLNETLMVGPTIQATIFEQILRFRIHRYVITGDIEKMYRQILIHQQDRKFQRILWRHERGIRTFQLNTVAFGTASAPFLAIRTIQQLARDEVKEFPRATKLFQRDFYVDDFISGAESLEEMLAIREEMTVLLRRGGFIIRKWASKHRSAWVNLEKPVVDLDYMVREDPIQKTLGIIWDSQRDELKYSVNSADSKVIDSKRQLLSELSKIYDPLGLLGPVVLFAKALIQDCWKAKISWDESLPQSIHTKWRSLAQQLSLLEQLSFPRQFLIPNPIQVDVHGFCDACNYGYGACLFVRSTDSLGNVAIRLVCSKSRVALTKGLTIPRLELCAASVLKNLYVKSKSQFEFPINRIIFWSDSTIVLCWLKKAPHLLRVFESNRVADIQSLEDQVSWKHVPSEANPADALSRGQLPSEFVKNLDWNSGPRWLFRPENEWPQSIEPSPTELPGIRQGVCLVTTPVLSFNEIYMRFSSYSRLVRVLAYVARWRNGSRNKAPRGRLCPEIEDSLTRTVKVVGSIRPLLPSEINASEVKIVGLIQQERFPSELRHLSKRSEPFKKGISFDKLAPFLDEKGVIRVGGRLQRSQLPLNQKHPMLLPRNHHVTDLFIRQTHLDNLHAGIQSTLYAIRVKFFIINGKEQVKRAVRRCIECIRQKPPIVHARMSDLPEARVKETPAFDHTGVDFFGPILLKEKAFKNKSFIKAYGCVLICSASKTVHIELAHDLSTEGFLSGFRRFVARRGIPSHVYSDNGTNFVGANKELQKIYDLFDQPEFRKAIGEHAIAKRIEWHFNPPLSPHFGGLWEAAVKSFKHHLKRILNTQLTYYQLETLLIEIEAILNFRPLCSLSVDPNDPLAVTPAHLLIGRPFNVLPENSLGSIPDNRLSTYHFITKAKQNFWNKWHKEYLHELQIRQKWITSNADLKTGLVVLLMDDLIHCVRWPLGVVVEVFPGSDGIARVASVRTAGGVYKRNITRLCPLSVL